MKRRSILPSALVLLACSLALETDVPIADAQQARQADASATPGGISPFGAATTQPSAQVVLSDNVMSEIKANNAKLAWSALLLRLPRLTDESLEQEAGDPPQTVSYGSCGYTRWIVVGWPQNIQYEGYLFLFFTPRGHLVCSEPVRCNDIPVIMADAKAGLVFYSVKVQEHGTGVSVDRWDLYRAPVFDLKRKTWLLPNVISETRENGYVGEWMSGGLMSAIFKQYNPSRGGDGQVLVFDLDHEARFIDGSLFVHRFGTLTLTDYEHCDALKVPGPTAEVNERFIYDPESDSLQPLF